MGERTGYIYDKANMKILLVYYGLGQAPFLSSFLCFIRNGGFDQENEFPSDQEAEVQWINFIVFHSIR